MYMDIVELCGVAGTAYECKAELSQLFGVNCVAVIANNCCSPGTHSGTVPIVYFIVVCFYLLILTYCIQLFSINVCRRFGSSMFIQIAFLNSS